MLRRMAGPLLTDIGSNLTDPIFTRDLPHILHRARAAGVHRQILTGDNVEHSRKAIELCASTSALPGELRCTVGMHPCRANEVPKGQQEEEAFWVELGDIASKGKGKGAVVAVGECGLDYDRLHFASKEDQLRVFPRHLALAAKLSLPLFLHSRHPDAHVDFLRIVDEWIAANAQPVHGVVHSFTGTGAEAADLLARGLYIGVNGCSLKTAENCEVVKDHIPLDRLMVESDCPWCEIRPSHASAQYLASLPPDLKEIWQIKSIKKEKFVPADGVMLKGRNEPMGTGVVAWVVAQLKGVGIEEVERQTEKNVEALFFGGAP